MPDDTRVSVQVEPVALSAGDKAAALDQVEEIQQEKRSEVRRIPLAEVPALLLPYQARWHADLSVVRLFEKSRRVGASWGCYAAEGALEAARANGMSQFYMGTNYAMAAENIGDVAFWARAFGFALGAIDVQREIQHIQIEDQSGAVIRNEKRDILRYRVQFGSGHVYEALSAAPYNWRGRQGHARIDEAAFMDDLAEVVKGALAFRLWGGRISIASTHHGDENPFNQFVREIRAGKLPWSLHRIDFDGALREGFYRRVCLIRGWDWSQAAEDQYRADAYADYPDPAAADEELGAIPRAGSGAYFSRILIEQCQSPDVPVLRWTAPQEFVTDPQRLQKTDDWIAEHLLPVLAALPGLRSVYGQDFGRSGDLSVTWVLQQHAPTLWRQAIGLELRNMPFDVQARVRDCVLGLLPLWSHACFDARGNGQSHAESAMQKYGAARVTCVMVTPAWYAEQFPPYRALFEDRAIVVQAGEDVIADHRRVVLAAGRPTMDAGRDKGADGGFRHGDSAVAGVMCSAAIRAEGLPAAGATIDPDPDTHRDTYTPDVLRGRARRVLGLRHRA